MKAAFVDKLIERLDRLDTGSVQSHFLRLAQEKGLLETIFHTLQEGVVVLDGDGDIQYANHSAERMLGFQFEKAVGQPIQRYLRDVDWDLVLGLDVGEWSRLVSREIEITYPEHRFVAFYLMPLATVDPSAEGAVLLLRDVTHERANERVALESERFQAITLLAAGVAHELGNPLNALDIHLQLMARELAGTAGEVDRGELAQMVDVCRQEVFRLDKIIKQFLGAVRPAELQLESADVATLVRQTVEFLHHEIEARNVRVKLDVEAAAPRIKIDVGQIKQAFFNVVKNGVEAMHAGGTLSIGITSNDRYVVVTFRDTGHGIGADGIGDLFEPYRTTKKEGSGLGLMIVHRIVRNHGGEIEVDSEVGRGTTFTLFLPRDERRIRMLEAAAESMEDPTDG